MDTLRQCAQALSQWVYTIYNVKIPLLNVSLWLFVISLLAYKMLLRAMDPVIHRSQGGQDQNNNRIYRSDR